MERPWAEYSTDVNRYGKRVGTTLEYWEEKGWIEPSHPYGWVQWYCDFFDGRAETTMRARSRVGRRSPALEGGSGTGSSTSCAARANAGTTSQ